MSFEEHDALAGPQVPDSTKTVQAPTHAQGTILVKYLY